MSRPRLLDLFCGAGGAAVGYHRAGFDVVGVDIRPQPHYPFEFFACDAMVIDRWWEGWREIGWTFDAVHASPPCQAYTWGTRVGREDKWPRLIGAVREMLATRGLPYVIENVPGAKAELRDPLLLCGSMFPGLGVIRHRYFESSVPLWPSPGHPRCQGSIARGQAVTVAGHGGDSKDFRISRWQEAMGIDWTRDRTELAEAIPPAYTEWIGRQLLTALESAA